ncbi:ATP-binding protein [Nocardioides terrigena]|uniref:ATP-binding protein n=1 Tax=Nocardioides terrigena TaxID=424797 RepID=UPI000D30995E|nr:ATP-binding protein [Nocardioides terrigena]
MPLTKQALPLSASPRAVADARRWVRDICVELGRDDLVECAELGVSELTTNAVLHGAEPIAVRVRGTRSHPRIEVIDGSSQPPSPPTPSADPEEFLTTFGRGLSIVAMSSVAWGASIEPDGKVVWFEPASEVREDGGAQAVIDSTVDDEPRAVSDAAKEVRFLGVDLRLYSSLSRQYYELRRELRLLAVAHQDHYPLAADLSAMFASYERQVPDEIHRAVRSAGQAGARTVDVSVRMEPEASSIVSTMMEMFDLADAFCKAERLLSLQRTPDQREFHLWYLGEMVRQLSGERPRSWHADGGDTGRVDTQHVS